MLLRSPNLRFASVAVAVALTPLLWRCGSNPELTGGSAGGSGGAAAGNGGSGGSSSAGTGNVINVDAGGGTDAAGGTGGGDASTEGCGDGAIQPGEVCDDGNSEPGDGCSGDCKNIEQGFGCPVPGSACLSTVNCGDDLIGGTETCDDGNNNSGDGCSATCDIEPGYECPTPGERCEAKECGDGIIAGNEQCEDGQMPPASGDGCSDTCRREEGFVCDTPGMPCRMTVCNDGIKEGDEPCDDGNQVIGDGCNPFCEAEPDCSGTSCVSACGDGRILPGDTEQCDDGNAADGDGCSSTCQIESGFLCNNTQGQLPTSLVVPATFRDFIARPAAGETRHPDFETFGGSQETPGLVGSMLKANGKPQYTGICDGTAPNGPCPYGTQNTTEANFDEWYTDGANRVTMISTLTLTQQPNGSYFFPDAAFFPFDNAGFVAQNKETASNGHNFGFTSEILYWFEFKGGEQLSFSGDDDVWVFVNKRLALDLGGLHPQRSGSFTLDTATATSLALEVGKLYEVRLFHAERHTNASNFNLTLNGFVSTESTCGPVCGDGIIAGDETCDDGVNDGSYGSCTPDCKRGPRCGDALLQDPPEVCDDGVNLATYSTTGMAGCAPGCVLGAFCGDAQVDSLFGEECDDGTNAGGYNGCKSDCRFGPRCGDGVVQTAEGEQCDDGNTVSGDGCSKECLNEGPA